MNTHILLHQKHAKKSGYILPVFPFFNIAVLFWDADDEFEAQANMLFDADITDFLHEETVVCIAADFVRRLGEEAGIGKVEHLVGGDIM